MLSKLFIIVLLSFLRNTQTIIDFKSGDDVSQWRTINDDVMGGISISDFYLNDDGHAVFSGKIRLDYNGGFASVRHRVNLSNIKDYSHVLLRVKGDGKRYQFRVKKNRYSYYSYSKYFETSGVWQTIKIPIRDLSPSFRGRQLDIPNFEADIISEITILVGNYREESFMIEIDKIELLK